MHATIADWARLVACQLQEGRDLSSAGFPPPTTGPTPPYLLTADTWRSIHHRWFYGDEWEWEPASYTLSSQSWTHTAIPTRLEEESRTMWWNSASRLMTRADPPFGITVTTNWGSTGGGDRPGENELDDRNKEALQALETLYEAWWQQQVNTPTNTARDGQSEDQSVLIVLTVAISAILLLTTAIVGKVRWDEQHRSGPAAHHSTLSNDEPLLPSSPPNADTHFHPATHVTRPRHITTDMR